jgi:hypothetical protein
MPKVPGRLTSPPLQSPWLAAKILREARHIVFGEGKFVEVVEAGDPVIAGEFIGQGCLGGGGQRGGSRRLEAPAGGQHRQAEAGRAQAEELPAREVDRLGCDLVRGGGCGSNAPGIHRILQG